jgi:hypothetical protein
VALIDDFRSRFPEFSDENIDLYIPILETSYGCYYGGSYEGCDVEVILNLLAHLLVQELNLSSESTKEIASQAVGNVSVSYGSNSSASSGLADDGYRSTKYGMRFLMLTRSRHGAFFV